jgi:hypothetical protein
MAMALAGQGGEKKEEKKKENKKKKRLPLLGSRSLGQPKGPEPAAEPVKKSAEPTTGEPSRRSHTRWQSSR